MPKHLKLPESALNYYRLQAEVSLRTCQVHVFDPYIYHKNIKYNIFCIVALLFKIFLNSHYANTFLISKAKNVILTILKCYVFKLYFLNDNHDN